mmetsp:Transcript_4277/g.12327  ORF Transcript_4277/g.12327 Transcript_4277/m.12327 type:complete len:528 (+) Transcript_4277:56-1639(+)
MRPQRATPVNARVANLAALLAALAAPASGRRVAGGPWALAARGVEAPPLAGVRAWGALPHIAAAGVAGDAPQRPSDGGGASESLVRALDVRGGDFSDVVEPILSSFHKVKPLLLKIDKPLRIAIMSYGVYDKLRRGLKIMATKPVAQIDQAAMLAAAGGAIKATEAVRDLLEQAIIDGEDAASVEARRVKKQVLQEIDSSLERQVDQAAAFALGLNAKKISKIMQAEADGVTREEALGTLRIADEVECDLSPAESEGEDEGDRWQIGEDDRDDRGGSGGRGGGRKGDGGGCHAVGDYVDLSGEALLRAADMDVSEEFGLEPMDKGGPRLGLLGLVMAFAHERVFNSVLSRIPGPEHRRNWTIASYTEAQCVTGVAGLIRKKILEYETPAKLDNLRVALYTAATLRTDPLYFQIGWGMKLASMAALAANVSRQSNRVAIESLKVFDHVVVVQAVEQLVKHYVIFVNTLILTPFERLKVVNALLNTLLFAHEHGLRGVLKFFEVVEKMLLGALGWSEYAPTLPQPPEAA